MDESSMISDYIVANIDILGQKEYLARLAKVRLRDFDHFKQAMETSEFRENMSKTFGAVDRIRRLIDGFLATVRHRNACHPSVSDSERQEYEKITKSAEIKIQPLADALIIHVCVRNEISLPCTVMNALFSVMLALATVAPMSLAEGNPIRGGIDLHWACELKDGEIYGPALYTAYNLESTVAKYPRIVIGKGLVSYLEYFMQLKLANREDNYAREMANWCAGLVGMESDKCHILDYLGEVYKNLMNDYDESALAFKDVLPKAFSQARSSLENFRQEKNRDLTEDYEKLVAYYESRAPIWLEDGIDFRNCESA